MAVVRKTHVILFTAVLSYFLVHLRPEFSIKNSIFLTCLTYSTVILSIRHTYLHLLWPKVFSPLKHLPTPPEETFFNGSGWTVLNEPTGIPHRRWVNSIKNNGLILYHYFGNNERVMLSSPEALREVLVTKCYDFHKPSLARVNLGRLLGVGILLAEGEEHKTQRKNLMPAFQYRHIRDLFSVFWEKSNQMGDAIIDEISGDQNKKPTEDGYSIIQVDEWLHRCTLDIIGLAGMGFDFNAIADPNNELNITYKSVFNPQGKSIKIWFLLNQVVPQSIIKLLPMKRNLDVVNAANVVRNVSRKIIEEKQAKMAEKDADVGKDIISVALASGGFSVDNLIDQSMTFLAAGHETTATATSWALLTLAKRQDVQQRLRDEIRELLPSPSSSTPVTADLVDKMPYLHAVCNEVLRFHAPVPLTRRIAIRDTTIVGQVIPKGTAMVISPWATNFDKNLWGPDAAEFNPDRWMGEKRANSGGAESNFANLTFLHGPRSCIGLGFAKAEFLVLLASIVGRFQFDYGSEEFRGQEVQTGIVARPKGGASLKMRAVEGW